MSDAPKPSTEVKSAWAFPENDPNAEGVVGWPLMGARERVEACLAAVLARWPLDPETFRYDPRRDLVYVLRVNTLDPEKTDVATRVVGSLHLALDKLRAALGGRAVDVQKACTMRAEKAVKVLREIR